MRPAVTTLRTPMRRASGFTIVELMVGMLIGLVSIIVMFQVFAVSEGQRRTATGVGDAQQNGVTSLYLIERDARLAGYGVNFFRMLGCSVNGYWNPSSKVINFTLAPVVIVSGATSIASDKVTFLYSDTDTVTFPSILSNATTSSAAGFLNIRDDRFPFKMGDLFVVGEIPAPLPASQVMKPCSMFQVTDLPAASPQQINFNGSSYIDDTGANRAANYVPPSAASSTQMAPNNVYYAAWTKTTASGGRIMNLGNQPTLMQYSIVNNQLVATDLMQPDNPPVALSDGIIQFQAQYGFSAGCQSTPAAIVPCMISPTATTVSAINLLSANDQWGDTIAGTPGPADWRKIIAMRFIIVARSGTQEKVNPTTGVCNTTTVMPVWSVNNQTIDISADPNWKCYRYRTFEEIVPIRNFIWFPDPNGTSEAPA